VADFVNTGSRKAIDTGERLNGSRLFLRLVVPDDCNAQYVSWLADPQVHQYLETRWKIQSLEAIRSFVEAMVDSQDDYLFAIVDSATSSHIGNLKVGSINWNHAYADISYFIGEASFRGQGYASEAIRLAVEFSFSRLGLHRIQAGVYHSNRASAKALETAGFRHECALREQLVNAQGQREDMHYYGLLRHESR
jgi:ribosomal-protein-alanine N-acetyltransferase